MQTVDIEKCIEGIFIKELKNRFLCEVMISGVLTVCYVPSSCHLSNFLSLQGKKVLLVPTSTPEAKTKYALFAIPFKKNYILLNTSMANYAIEKSISGRLFSYLGKRKRIYTEHFVQGYKADIFIEDTKTIIEVKSVLSVEPAAKFPTVFSERSLDQIKKLQELHSKGYNVCYYIVALNPYIKEINLVEDTELCKELRKCADSGMIIRGYKCGVISNDIRIKGTLSIKEIE